MPTTVNARLTFVIALLVAAAALAGCSGNGSGNLSAGTTAPSTAGPSTSVVLAGSAACEPAALVPVIQKKYGPPGVDQLVCLAPAAILTVKTGGDDTVAFLMQKDGAWTVVADGPTADAEKLAPKDFPLSLLRSWQDKRNPTTRGAPTTRRVGPTTPQTIEMKDGKPVCRGEGGEVVKCQTTLPPQTTTTRPPTTKAPTTTEPVTTPPSTPPTTFSQFCLDHPLDPSCSGKK